MKKIFRTLMLAAIATLTFSSCEDVPSPYTLPGLEPKPEVVAKKVTCAEAIEIVNALADGASTAETYSITGYIVYVFSTVSQGQQSFWLSDTENGAQMIQAYWANLPEGVASFTKGAKVTITGQLMKYVKGDTVTPEMKNANVTFVNGEGNGGNEPVQGTEITCAQGVEIVAGMEANATSADTYSITGYIVDVFATISKGQQSFWLSDIKDGEKQIQAYWANLPEGVSEFKKGSKVTITGQLLKYVKNDAVTAEIKNANVVILEEGEEEGGNDNQPTGDPKGDGSEKDPYNVAGALAYINTLSSSDKPEALVYTEGIISQVVKLGNSKSIQFKMSDNGEAANELLVYYCNNLGNVPFNALEDLKAGDKVIVCGKVVNYQGNTPEYASGAYLVSLNGKTEAEGGNGDNGDNSGNGGNTTTTTGDFMSISSLPADITSNSYGSQATANESTWLSWTWNNIDFAGCKVCKATDANGAGIQMQGNDSDASKQGFIFNKTPWANNIKKITLILKVVASNTNDPNYHLYAGNEAHPAGTPVTPSSSNETIDGFRVYTEVFDLSNTSAKFFTIANDKVGALYIDKIIVE